MSDNNELYVISPAKFAKIRQNRYNRIALYIAQNLMNKIKIIKREAPKFKIVKKDWNQQGNIISNTQEKLFSDIKPETSEKVKPIEKTITKINSINDIKEIVEWPLISTIENFFWKHIETVSSSANGTNIHIMLRYDTLSQENKEIAKKLWGSISCSWWSGFRPLISFSLPPIITPTQYITARWERLANQFKEQKIFKLPSYTPDEFASLIMKTPGADKEEILRSPYFSAYEYDKQFNIIKLRKKML